jgi:hypothetical protein
MCITYCVLHTAFRVRGDYATPGGLREGASQNFSQVQMMSVLV